MAPPVPRPQAPAPAVPQVSPELREKANRFARLLVEEIKLYNQTQVVEGRANCDLYSRLREAIEMSRTAYNKRYAESVKDIDYFHRELIRILAEDKPERMGADFPG